MIRYDQPAKLYVGLDQALHSVYLCLVVAYEDKPYSDATHTFPEHGCVAHWGILHCRMDAQGIRLLYELMRIFKVESFTQFDQTCDYIDNDKGNTMQNIKNGMNCRFVYQENTPMQLINPETGQILHLNSFKLSS